MSSSDTESSSSSMEVPKEEGKVTKPEDDTTMKKKEGRVGLGEEGTEVVVSLEVAGGGWRWLEVARHSPLRHFSSSAREGVGFNQT